MRYLPPRELVPDYAVYHVAQLFAGQRSAQTRTNQVLPSNFVDAPIVLRVGFLQVLPGRCLQLTMLHISVYPFQTVSHMYRVLMSPLIDGDFSQGYAPCGGF